MGGGRRNATQLDKNENLRAQVPAGGVILKPTLPGYRKDHQRPERARPTLVADGVIERPSAALAWQRAIA